MTGKEKYYDEALLPKIVDLATACEEQGLSFLALCEWEPGEYGRTVVLQQNCSPAFRMADAAARATGNIDSFLLAMKRHAITNGHSSLYLANLGIPEVPEPPDPTIQLLQEKVLQLQSDLDEADRRAGAAERANAKLIDEASARKSWLSKAKREAGYDEAVSFDVVWQETLKKAAPVSA
jgi:hypothetical protein